MELTDLHISWLDFAKVAVLITIVYLIITLIGARLWTKVQHRKPEGLIRFLRFLYWPLASIIILAAFICINPLLHGLVFLLIAAIFWALVKNFFLGVFLKYRQRLVLGKSYKIGKMQGKLLKMIGTCAEFKTEEGLVYMPYSNIAHQNITHLVNKHKRCILRLVQEDHNQNMINKTAVSKILYDCPLINWERKPELNDLDQRTIHLDTELKDGVSVEALISYIAHKIPSISVTKSTTIQ